ncbi:MAG: hypothetical protein AAF721_26000 [Myxococcota bacterium]
MLTCPRTLCLLPALAMLLTAGPTMAKPGKKGPSKHQTTKAKPQAGKIPTTTSKAKLGPKTNRKAVPKSAGAQPHVLPRAKLNEVRKARPLDKAAKAKILAAGGIAAQPSDIGAPTTVAIRSPWVNTTTHLSITGLSMVYPHMQRGIALVGQSGGHDAYDDVPAPPVPGGPNPISFDDCTIGPCVRPILPGHSTPARGKSYATLRFKAAASKAYIVDCIAAGSDELHAQVIVNKEFVGRKSAEASGHFDLLVSAGARRNVRIDLFSAEPWNIRQCTITPVG